MERILSILKRHRLAAQTEEELQAAIAACFDAEGIEFRREHHLSPADRVDFLVGRTGVEVKVGGSQSALIRQVHRYAQSEELDAIIIVTTRAYHTIPADQISGCRVVVVNLVMENAF